MMRVLVSHSNVHAVERGGRAFLVACAAVFLRQGRALQRITLLGTLKNSALTARLHIRRPRRPAHR